MALFGDEVGDVGPFAMAEGGEEWFPFTLDNLEMDRACSPLQEDSKPMEQVRRREGGMFVFVRPRGIFFSPLENKQIRTPTAAAGAFCTICIPAPPE